VGVQVWPHDLLLICYPTGLVFGAGAMESDCCSREVPHDWEWWPSVNGPSAMLAGAIHEPPPASVVADADLENLSEPHRRGAKPHVRHVEMVIGSKGHRGREK